MKIIGYHGTTVGSANLLLSQESPFRLSNNDGDWLGRGAYFFQDGPKRALAWARKYKSQTEPAVVVAELDIANRIDLFDVNAWVHMRAMLPTFAGYEAGAGAGAISAQGGLKVADGRARMVVPASTAPKGLIANHRDRAFLNWCVEVLEGEGAQVDAIRAPFLFGDALFNTSFLFDESHVQIAIRNPSKINPLSVLTS